VFNVKTNATNAEALDSTSSNLSSLVGEALIQPFIDTAAVAPASTVRILRLNWFDEASYPNEKIDVILGSDLVYERRILPPLMVAIQQLVAEDGYFLYVAPDENRQGMEDIIACLEEVGLTLQQRLPCPPE
jgi:predicted nicotinamide N-methyase